MQKIGICIKLAAVSGLSYIRKNPHMALAALLFLAGIAFLSTKVSTISGALFGAGASLLGAWVTELNNRRSNSEDKARRESEARRYLAPELNRTIERVLYIHQRAIPTFSSASIAYAAGEQIVKPNDLQKDFIPYMPTLYPNAPQFRDLTGDDATALIAFYDSLHTLDKFVNEWWEREGQLHINIFNMILTYSDESLRFAEDCIQKFELEKLYPPKYDSWGTLSSRIECSKVSAIQAREYHMARLETKNAKPAR
ncbi:hypothetical protein [Methylobacter sp.]|uniref:hypothetical protein n=1 Tax=Methylobacter sp. TaxID=2051955 RepID=UPI001213EA19|nr:hypothetical protein [Methylobacter sp.]TAK64184.1 MAG: hypothetical protein EPO18_04480 [Methylobacter sp.]